MWMTIALADSRAPSQVATRAQADPVSVVLAVVPHLAAARADRTGRKESFAILRA